MSQKEQMFRDIGIVDFVLVELALYLDTHPYDREVIEYYNHYLKIKNQMTREFSQKYFPLQLSYADSMKEWRWGSAPLPWEPWEGGC